MSKPENLPPAAAIITAGGVGRRLGGPGPKQFLPLAGRPVLIRALEACLRAECLTAIVLTLPAEHLDAGAQMLARHGLAGRCRLTVGGATRQESVLAGLNALPAGIELVLVHDGARPLVDPELIRACLAAAGRDGAAIVAVPVKDTIKSVAEGRVAGTVDRRPLWRAQTPQAARLALLRQAYEAAAREGFRGTDESSLLERIGCPVAVVTGSEDNLKITVWEDMAMAEALLVAKEGKTPPPRIGHGYDAHRLVPGRALILGGVLIPHPTGLLGHSDADALTHALCDALLGALGLGDIGRHFPDTDPRYAGIDSLRLLAQVVELATARGWAVGNADLTVVAQRPKLAPFLAEMRARLAAVCQVAPEAINLKATTTEGMGFAGREEGIACHAVALLLPRERP